jgi:hypothetical protein
VQEKIAQEFLTAFPNMNYADYNRLESKTSKEFKKGLCKMYKLDDVYFTKNSNESSAMARSCSPSVDRDAYINGYHAGVLNRNAQHKLATFASLAVQRCVFACEDNIIILFWVIFFLQQLRYPVGQ